MTKLNRQQTSLDNSQQDLFSNSKFSFGGQDTLQRKRQKRADRLFDYEQNFSVRVSYEIIVMAVLGGIVFVLAAYIFGVHQGKKEVLDFRKTHIKSVPLTDLIKEPLDHAMASLVQEQNGVQESKPVASLPEKVAIDSRESLQNDSLASEAKPAAVEKPPLRPAMFYSIQVASFRDKESASQIKERYEKKGYQAFILESTSSAGTVWFKLFFNSYRTYSDAKDNQGGIVKEGFKDCFIKKMTRDYYDSKIVL